jgi:hypothetical protein
VFVCDKCSSSDKTAKITAVLMSSSASAAATGQRLPEFNIAIDFVFLCAGIHV